VKIVDKETHSLYGTNIKTKCSHVLYTGRSCSFLTSAAIIGRHLCLKSRRWFVLCLVYINPILSRCWCPEIGTGSVDSPNWVGFTWRRRQNPVSETLCFEKQTGRWIMSRNIIFLQGDVFLRDVVASCHPAAVRSVHTLGTRAQVILRPSTAACSSGKRSNPWLIEIIAFRLQWCHFWLLYAVSHTGIASALQHVQVAF
jgi:hypothetical protein